MFVDESLWMFTQLSIGSLPKKLAKWECNNNEGPLINVPNYNKIASLFFNFLLLKSSVITIMIFFHKGL